MGTSGVENRRAYARFVNKEAVHIQFKNSDFSAGCLSYDLSKGGVKFLHNDFIPLGKEISLNVTLYNGEVIACTGSVVWVQKMPHSHRYQIGVKFIDDSLIYDARSRINSFFKETHSNN